MMGVNLVVLAECVFVYCLCGERLSNLGRGKAVRSVSSDYLVLSAT